MQLQGLTKMRLWHVVVLGVIGLGFPDHALAQTKEAPRLFYVSPLGGKAGATFEVTVTGQNMGDPESLYFDIPGVQTEYLGVGSGPSPAPTKKKGKGKMTGPQGSFKFKVTLPADARLGIHDVRLVSNGGISNPRAFVISDRKELVETEPNDDVPQAQRIEINTSVSGAIANPTDVDYYVFTGKKGQRVLISCLTTSIDSKLPAVLELYSDGGSFLGSNRGYHEDDALLDCTLPEDGDYHLRLTSFTYTQGGPDYFYHLTVSTAPWIDAVFPAAVEPGKTTSVTVYGRNLPQGKPADFRIGGKAIEKITMAVKVPADARALQRLDYSGFIPPRAGALNGFELRLRADAGSSNLYLLAYASAPLILDQGNNDTPETAQKVTAPCEIAGWIEKKGDKDWYVFEAKKGEVYSIDLAGDRLASPLDLYFSLHNPKGGTITEQDDSTEILSPQFYTRSNDPPRYRFVVPADGEYQVVVSSREAYLRAGPRHRYLLRITPERPDFRLVLMTPGVSPAAPVIGQGGNEVLQVLVWAQDGFQSDIHLSGEDLPPGITVPPQVLPVGQKQAYVVIHASEDAAPWAGAIKIVGTATVGGKKLVREARSASITWPVPIINIPSISRLDRTLVLAIRNKAPFTLAAQKDRFQAVPGSKIAIPLQLTWVAKMKNTVTVFPLNLPQGMTFKNLALTADKKSAVASLDISAAAKPGSYTILLRGQTGPVQMKKGGPPPKGPVGLFQYANPVSVTVLPKQVAKLGVPGTVKVAVGKQVEVAIKASRLYDFGGPFRVELVPGPGTKGLQAPAMQIPAGTTEGVLVIAAADNAAPGTRQVVVRATAMFHGTPIVHEAKININVVRK